MKWLRYNTFYVLYPVGISSECVLIWKASMVAERPLQLVFWGVLGVYVPGKFFSQGEQRDGLIDVRRKLHSFHAYDCPEEKSHAGESR